MSKKLETVTNIAIVTVAIIASAVLVKNYLLSKPRREPPPQIGVGERLALPGVDWAGYGNTLVLALSPGCDSCSESAPFYRRLKTDLPNERVHFTAITPATAEDGREYLRNLQVDVADVRQVSLRELNIRGTPTLLLVDEQGVVRNVWLGHFSPEKEQEVIDTIRAAIS